MAGDALAASPIFTEDAMPILTVVFTLIVVGVLLYLVNVYALWLLNIFGVFAYLGNPTVPRIGHR